jgi:hypothetical protein
MKKRLVNLNAKSLAVRSHQKMKPELRQFCVIAELRESANGLSGTPP